MPDVAQATPSKNGHFYLETEQFSKSLENHQHIFFCFDFGK